MRIVSWHLTTDSKIHTTKNIETSFENSNRGPYNIFYIMDRGITEYIMEFSAKGDFK